VGERLSVTITASSWQFVSQLNERHFLVRCTPEQRRSSVVPLEDAACAQRPSATTDLTNNASSLFRCLYAGSRAAHERQDARHRTQHGMEAGACPLPHWRASKCVMPGSTMSETATVATRPTKSPRTDLSSNFEGCLHRWPPHAALLARELAESLVTKVEYGSAVAPAGC